MTKNLIGLTGGIATGKSTVANYLATTYNLPIIGKQYIVANGLLRKITLIFLKWINRQTRDFFLKLNTISLSSSA